MLKRNCFRISSLLWADIVVRYTFFVMQNYLTDVWGLSFTHSAAILNIWGGICLILPVFNLYIVDEFFGHFKMLVLGSIAYFLGIAFIAMSAPPVLANSTGTCEQYESHCIGSIQKVLFYTGLSLIAVGMSGTTVSVRPFLRKHMNDEDEELRANSGFKILGFVIQAVLVLAAWSIRFAKPWTVRFWIPAACAAEGIFLFLSGYVSYDKRCDVEGSPVTDVFRVYVVAAKKQRQQYPLDCRMYKTANLDGQEHFRRTMFLRCLEKAAIDSSRNESSKWKVCTVKEVEEAKFAARIIPVWITFIICGVVSSIGNTYFLEQSSHMNRRIGKWDVPLEMLLLFSTGVGGIFNYCADFLLWGKSGKSVKLQNPRTNKTPAFGVGLAMIFSVLCYITAARVEEIRLGVIRNHDLLEKPEDDIPMSVFWLFFQIFLLAGLDTFLLKGMLAFYVCETPGSMKAYVNHLISGIQGLGFMSSVLSVYVVGRISERGGRTNWFQFTLNKSHLDRYYWVLAGVSGMNIVIFVLVAKWFYRGYLDFNER